MHVGDFTIEWRGERVVISGPDAQVASGRWLRGAIVERTGKLADSASDDAARWELIESALRRQADELIASSVEAAYDARGVDVTQIDRMLRLTPSERLSLLDDHRRSILSLLGDAPRE